MTRRALLLLATALGLAAGPAVAEPPPEAGLSPEALMTLAADRLAAGDPASAAHMTNALIARDDADVPALILRAEAAVALRDYDSAQRAARQAWRQAEVPAARYASARLAAVGLAGQERDTLAQFWLRRARQHAPDAASRAAVADDFRYLRRRNPLSFSVDFSVSPTNNLNNGTTNETIVLPGLPFVFALTGDARPLSGTEFTAGGQLRYRLRERTNSLTYVDVGGYGRTYRLSDEAREIKPDAEGADYGELQLSLGLGHVWAPDGGRDPWRFAITAGRFWYGGEAWSDFTRLKVGRGVTIGPRDRLDFGLSAERVVNHETADTEAVGVDASYSHDFGAPGALTLSLGRRSVTSEGFDRAYEARSAGIGWRFESDVTLFHGIEARDYALTAYRLDAREDVRRTTRVEVPVQRVEFYGFQPVLHGERVHTDSNVTRFETETLGGGLTFRSAF
ncbi:hypothetical protein OG2516_15654 [Oceanicola granulosus HTCC2516]|uniref:DUF560 domain-containing protein n=1 Tax=Oceanicola granulosus (strain ATCC BAA-861 / DSM 15982 / KCTC 12143 / HTCC2516) TaxID=314256 RepID=Q2CF82_OCEGH|nr:hypothetical protein [Oceanicola granulosus]EAR51413.1 hypothetical protein OG2516_15654 [Oceanicola granulosus HTCC2516]